MDEQTLNIKKIGTVARKKIIFTACEPGYVPYSAPRSNKIVLKGDREEVSGNMSPYRKSFMTRIRDIKLRQTTREGKYSGQISIFPSSGEAALKIVL